jgi:hypothetical protein
MFILLESKRDIALAQSRLKSTIRRDFTKTVMKDIGYPGGIRRDARLHTDGKYWFETHDRRRGKNERRLNWFGYLRAGSSVNITVEVNPPYDGINKMTGGFFVKDSDSGKVYLFHSGRVGGGKKGVGMTAFLAWSNPPLENVFDSAGNSRRGVLVMPIAGSGATRSLTRYIDEIANFKIARDHGEIETAEARENQRLFREVYAEGRGRRKGHRASEIDYLSRHGDVVDALRAWCEANSRVTGNRLVKNAFFDLGVSSGPTLAEVYEVKTSTKRSNIYAAIGQLLVHGNAASCKRTMVLPAKEHIANDLMGALKRLNIKLLRFKLDPKKATII